MSQKLRTCLPEDRVNARSIGRLALAGERARERQARTPVVGARGNRSAQYRATTHDGLPGLPLPGEADGYAAASTAR